MTTTHEFVPALYIVRVVTTDFSMGYVEDTNTEHVGPFADPISARTWANGYEIRKTRELRKAIEGDRDVTVECFVELVRHPRFMNAEV